MRGNIVDYLDFDQWFDFRLELIYTTSPTASKNDALFKSGQNSIVTTN